MRFREIREDNPEHRIMRDALANLPAQMGKALPVVSNPSTKRLYQPNWKFRDDDWNIYKTGPLGHIVEINGIEEFPDDTGMEDDFEFPDDSGEEEELNLPDDSGELPE